MISVDRDSAGGNIPARPAVLAPAGDELEEAGVFLLAGAAAFFMGAAAAFLTGAAFLAGAAAFFGGAGFFEDFPTAALRDELAGFFAERFGAAFREGAGVFAELAGRFFAEERAATFFGALFRAAAFFGAAFREAVFFAERALEAAPFRAAGRAAFFAAGRLAAARREDAFGADFFALFGDDFFTAARFAGAAFFGAGFFFAEAAPRDFGALFFAVLLLAEVFLPELFEDPPRALRDLEPFFDEAIATPFYRSGGTAFYDDELSTCPEGKIITPESTEHERASASTRGLLRHRTEELSSDPRRREAHPRDRS